MPKFALASDLHLTPKDTFIIKNPGDIDCLILAGDVCEFEQCLINQKPVLNFFDAINQEFEKVIWVPGNHEYYSSYARVNMETGISHMWDWLSENSFHNIFLGNNATTQVKGIDVHLATLWTDMKKADPMVMGVVGRAMNDYEYIRWNTDAKVVRPHNIVAEHLKSLEYLSGAIQGDCVVVSHHQPHFEAIEPIYRTQTSSYGYASDLSEFFLDRPQIRAWCSGHSHVRTDMVIGDTRFLTNCRGYYGYESMAISFQIKEFEV
jgi:predicted phosphodiesterase